MPVSQKWWPRHRADYLIALGHEPTKLTEDINSIVDPAGYRPHSYDALHSTMSAIADQMRIYLWYNSPSSGSKLVEGGDPQAGASISSTLSLFVVLQQQWLTTSGKFSGLVVCWCCSKHPLEPLQTMLKSLLGQVLSKITSHASVPVLETFLQAIRSNNAQTLCGLLNMLLLEHLKYRSMVFILEDVSCYEASPQKNQLEMVFEMLASVLRLPSRRTNFAFKLLMTTNSARTGIPHKAVVYDFIPEDVRSVITCNIVQA